MVSDVISVVLADDHKIVRAGIRAVLETARDIQVVAEGSSGQDAVDLVERLDPDVLVMDISMSAMDGLTATRMLSSKQVRSRILIFTMHSDEHLLGELLAAGATGFLTKAASSRELQDAVRSVAHGQPYVYPQAGRVLKDMASRKTNQNGTPTFESLAEREQQVLRLVAAGFSAPEIGAQLFISPKTVDSYKKRINEKLGFTTRSDYVSFALRLGLLSDDSGRETTYLISSSP